MFDAVVFAGGGNRCYWQGGFYEAAVARLGLVPRLVVGASAGAFAAVYSLLETGPATRARVIGACYPKLQNFDFCRMACRSRTLPVSRCSMAALLITFPSSRLSPWNPQADARWCC